MDKPEYFEQPDVIGLPTHPYKQTAAESVKGITRESIQVGDYKAETVKIGDAALTIQIDTSQVDNLISRLERAVAAFKAEWNKQ